MGWPIGYADLSLKPWKYLGHGTNVSNRSQGFTLAGGEGTDDPAEKLSDILSLFGIRFGRNLGRSLSSESGKSFLRNVQTFGGVNASLNERGANKVA
jgi:hypothetical protein